MLLAKHFLAALRLQRDSSFKFFDNIPEYLNSEIVEYLGVEDQIRFGMTCKDLLRASNRTRDFETKKMIEKYKIEEKYDMLDDEDILKELRTFASVSSVLYENMQIYFLPQVDFLDAVKTAHIFYDTLYLPKLTLAIVKAKYKYDQFIYVLRRVLNNPEKYKDVLKHLTKEQYKCKRNQLISRIRADYEGLKDFRFTRLREYNYVSKNNIIIRDGFKISIQQFSIIFGALYFYMINTNDFLDVKYCAKAMAMLFAVVLVYITRYLNERYEQFLE